MDGQEPEVFEDDVVCLASTVGDASSVVYGIVLETAWATAQEEDEEGDSEEDEDDEEDESEEDKQGDGKAKKGSNKGADDGEEEEDDDDEDDEEDRLEPGCVRVAWPDRREEELPASQLRVVDRSFLHGDVVVSRLDKQGQIGTVIDVQLLVDLHFEAVNGGPHAVALEQMPASSLELAQPFVVGRYVTRGQMLGVVQDCFVDIDVAFGPQPFSPAGLCTVRRPAPSIYKPKLQSKEELHEDEVGHGIYFPGMRVRAKHAQWKRASWRIGGHAAATAAGDVGTVVAVRPVELAVDWISGDDQAAMQRGSGTLRPDECTLLGLFEETRVQVGDHLLLAPECKEEHAERIRAHYERQHPSIDAAATDSGAGASAAAAAAPAVAAASSASKPGAGSKKGAAAAASASAAPAALDLSHLFSFCGTIARTSTSIRVQWQDGSVTPFLPSLDFVSRDHLLEDDFMVRDFAVTHAHQRLVHVLAVNARERMVHVRYLSKALRQAEVGPWMLPDGPDAQQPQQPQGEDADHADDLIEEGHTEWVPCMDLKCNPAFEFCLGGVVLRVPGHRDDASSAVLPADSKLGHAGQVEHIDEQGRLTVVWADRTRSTLEADQLLIVEHDEDGDGGDEEDEEWEDDDEEEEEEAEEVPHEEALAEEAAVAQEQDDEQDEEEEDEEDDEDDANDGAISAEWNNRDFWRKDGPAAPDSSSSTGVGSSSVAAVVPAAASVDDAVSNGMAALSVSSGAAPPSARPGSSYSSFAMLDAPADENDESAAACLYRAALSAHKWSATACAPHKGKVFAKRVRDELKQLSSSLPPGVHVRAYEGRMDLFSLCIFGTVGTPYELSLFTFDLSLPADYPASPPLMHFHSRGHRLSPNLYLDGTICLSLLNTWKASLPSQRWDGAHSTLLQLFVSLQGLVIGAQEPYYLEAGYESQRGQKQANLNSHLYNETALLTSLAHLTSYATAAAAASSSATMAAAPFGAEIAEHVRSDEVQQRARELQALADAWERKKRQQLTQFTSTAASETPAAAADDSSASVELDEAALATVLARFAIHSEDALVAPSSSPPAEAAAAAAAASAVAPAAVPVSDGAASSNAASLASSSSAAAAAAPAVPAGAPVVVPYHPSLAFVTMLVRQMRSLIAALDRAKETAAAAAAGSQQDGTKQA